MERPAPPLRVLVVDDEKNIRTTLALCLQGVGCEVAEASNGEAALQELSRRRFDVAFLDVRLGAEDGLAVLSRLLEESPRLEVVLVTAYGTIDSAVEAMRRGARDYLAKPFSPAQIRAIVERLGRELRAQRRLDELEARLAEAAPEAAVESRSPAMRAALDLIAKAAAHDAPVLFLGESGTGKGVLARALHAASPRHDHPFVVVNCPTLSEELLASELFGHAKGAFTGAVRDQEGRVEAAEGGTLFLDEIAEIPPGLQAKLLRFLQDKQFERLGESRTREAHVRVVAATNRKLEDEVKAGRFREDLYYRLNTLEIALPPLRDRREDILPLAQAFLVPLARAARRAVPELSDAARKALVEYTWPGNLRELRNVLERALILEPGRILDVTALPDRLTEAAGAGVFLGGDFTLETIEREHVERVVARAPSLEEAARILGIDASTLWRKRKKYEEG
ncbi:MAG TPA: sigma-54 dependent transcriptional regulator [Myxococcales bacterium]|nr:sigma-54 dependent transcriptional regulator [Myxococcales bacterium]